MADRGVKLLNDKAELSKAKQWSEVNSPWGCAGAVH